ncbi:hypothetical protein HK405_003161 [Cladochytrium tenue]|nr:hypothetical protein HK405_003161 [Cladochytrium tenue]
MSETTLTAQTASSASAATKPAGAAADSVVGVSTSSVGAPPTASDTRPLPHGRRRRRGPPPARRVAETDLNVKGGRYLEGQLDTEINERGAKQAEALAQRLRGARFDHIYCSDLKRAVQTADHIARHHPAAAITLDPRLREQHLGDLAGVPWREAKRRLRELDLTLDERAVASGGERRSDVRAHVEEFYQDVVADHLVAPLHAAMDRLAAAAAGRVGLPAVPEPATSRSEGERSPLGGNDAAGGNPSDALKPSSAPGGRLSDDTRGDAPALSVSLAPPSPSPAPQSTPGPAASAAEKPVLRPPSARPAALSVSTTRHAHTWDSTSDPDGPPSPHPGLTPAALLAAAAASAAAGATPATSFASCASSPTTPSTQLATRAARRLHRRNILVVTHGGPIRALLALLLSRDLAFALPEHLAPPAASASSSAAATVPRCVAAFPRTAAVYRLEIACVARGDRGLAVATDFDWRGAWSAINCVAHLARIDHPLHDASTGTEPPLGPGRRNRTKSGASRESSAAVSTGDACPPAHQRSLAKQDRAPVVVPIEGNDEQAEHSKKQAPGQLLDGAEAAPSTASARAQPVSTAAAAAVAEEAQGHSTRARLASNDPAVGVQMSPMLGYVSASVDCGSCDSCSCSCYFNERALTPLWHRGHCDVRGQGRGAWYGGGRHGGWGGGRGRGDWGGRTRGDWGGRRRGDWGRPGGAVCGRRAFSSDFHVQEYYGGIEFSPRGRFGGGRGRGRGGLGARGTFYGPRGGGFAGRGCMGFGIEAVWET